MPHSLNKVPLVCVSLPPSLPPAAVAHMTEAAAADYRFSCGGRAPSHSFFPPLCFPSQHQPVQSAGLSADDSLWFQLIISALFFSCSLCFPAMLFPPVSLLPENILRLFAKQLLLVS